MKSKSACGSRERERERESRNLGKIEEREGLYSKNRPLFICTTKVKQGRSVNDNASSILEMQSIRKNNNTKSILNAVSGITLIALVVTIVVLLILASVSITVVFGDNGILQLAKEAGEKTNEAVQNDKENIGNATNYIKSLSWDTSKVTAVTTKDGAIVPVPKGFVGSEVNGENTIKDGFVIYEIPEGKNLNWKEDKNEDGILDVQQDCNQFVWVPADGISLEYKQDKETWKSKSYRYYNDYDKNWTDEESKEEQAIVKREESVKKYGGFYVGRYESGVEESKDYKDGSPYQGNVTKRNITNGTPVTKKGRQAWNYVDQIHAKELSKNMYISSTSVTSRLIDSYAWDTICTWLSNDGIDVLNSTSWGNYIDSVEHNVNGLYATYIINFGESWTWKKLPKDSTYAIGEKKITTRTQSGDVELIELATGIDEQNKAKNIYDFAGNLWEWTTEEGNENGQKYGVMRSGSFASKENEDPASIRKGSAPNDYADVYNSFRIVLYLK